MMDKLEDMALHFLQEVDSKKNDVYYNRGGLRHDPLILDAFEIIKQYYQRNSRGTIQQQTHQLEGHVKELEAQVTELENEIADLHSTGEY